MNGKFTDDKQKPSTSVEHPITGNDQSAAGQERRTGLSSEVLPVTPVDNPPVIQHPELNISRHLKAPRLPYVKPYVISHEQAQLGITVNIPGSAHMRFGDRLVFYWGRNRSSTTIHLRTIPRDTTVRVLCVAYPLINHPQYGPVDVYYEIIRGPFLIGTSQTARVVVKPEPVTSNPEGTLMQIPPQIGAGY
jgi:hypothetical protein